MLTTVFVAAALGAASMQLAGLSVSLLISAENPNPIVLGRQLAEAGVPAGIEVRETDDDRVGLDARRPDGLLKRREQLRGDSPVTIEQVIATFNRHHRTYKATSVNGVIVIRPRDQQADYLNGSAPFAELVTPNLSEFARQLFAPLSGPWDPGGRPGSSPSTPGEKPDLGERDQVKVDAKGKRVIDVLNEVAVQHPGHVWLVVSDSEGQVASLGFLHNRGARTRNVLRRGGKPVN